MHENSVSIFWHEMYAPIFVSLLHIWQLEQNNLFLVLISFIIFITVFWIIIQLIVNLYKVSIICEYNKKAKT